MLRDTTSRGLYVRVWPPHTSERRGGGGGCEQEGWQGGEGRAMEARDVVAQDFHFQVRPLEWLSSEFFDGISHIIGSYKILFAFYH